MSTPLDASGFRRWRGAILAVAGTIAVAMGGIWWLVHRGIQSTDDAQLDADVVAVPARTGGTVARVLFADNQAVKAGQVLAELDPAPAQARLALADANLEAARASADAADADARVVETNAHSNLSMAQAGVSGATSSAAASRSQITAGDADVARAQASADNAKADLARARTLFADTAIAKAQLDDAQAAYDAAAAALASARARAAALRASAAQAASQVEQASAKLRQSADVDALIEQARAKARTAHAQVATAQAQRELAALERSYVQIVAPEDGVVSKRSIAVGTVVAAGQPIAQLVPSQALWVTANFKETQIADMRPGQPVVVDVDAFPDLTLHGRVASFAAATGARFSLLPPDNASGNFTKVVQRVPVKIVLDDIPDGLPLRPGLSADVRVNTRR
jgi:membrane fusion protein (multidrug efflux system)